MFMIRRIAVILVAVLWAATASAQFEDFDLSPGFTPDPATGTGISGGSVDAAGHGSTSSGPCTGKIDTTPDHTLVLRADFSQLRVQVNSAKDTSLVIRGPAGYRCNDDGDGLNPVIEGYWPAGTYQIYVGSVDTGAHSYTISISELPPGASLPGSASGDYESVVLAPGFEPDPRILTGTSGGGTDAASMGSSYHGPCVGKIDGTPDHVVTLSNEFAYLKLHVLSDADTSLVIRGPDGLRCNDDTDGLNPVVQGRWPAGRYEVFVGSVAEGFHRYRLRVTEFR
ncbi:hypothetical protein Tgr7_2601 [Thioalkalivibrio sulfidiphilus HL-EbGr7]|uniref:Peptidase domain protein n=3 Tax=Thioalkalivibrio TaxID=106633 RepID=B8GM89_THISH|nr:hypothetical protein Tgr7_2601 [Thioalkalivibrio sulfidiphilus HL-EbGr7]